MCLHNIILNTKKVCKEGFVGIGYKSYGIFCPYKLSKWYKARRNYGSNEYSDDYTLYYPRFHIFLEQDSVENYSYCRTRIAKVSFKEIICFGTNRSGSDYKRCVVANWMRIDKWMK